MSGSQGSSFEEWLREEGIYEEVTARAIERIKELRGDTETMIDNREI